MRSCHLRFTVTLGNHDTMPRGFNTPHTLSNASNALSWNYDLVSCLWHKYHWLPSPASRQAAAHYGAYSVLHPTLPNLRIISLNSDFYFRGNIFNYINITNPDPSGILAWLASELTHSENHNERAWIIAHVPPGYDGSASLPNLTALLYSIIRRFSPATIAAVFFGHTHQDQLLLFYDHLPTSLCKDGLRNTSAINFAAPLQTSYIGPSITPLTGLNSGYRVYQIDSLSYEVVNHQTYIANMSNSLFWHRPIWQLEYDAREAYTRFIPWPENAPLNASFWHAVTEKMLDGSEEGRKLWEMYERFGVKSSDSPIQRGGMVGVQEKVCYIRSGSGEIGDGCRRRFGDG